MLSEAPLDLTEIPLFAALTPAQIHALRDMIRVRHFTAGETVIREGEHNPGRIFVVIIGTAVLSKKGRSAIHDTVVDYEVGVREAKSVFGVMPVMDGAPMSVSVMAKTPLTVGVIDLYPRNGGRAARSVRNAIIGELRRTLAADLRSSLDDKVQSLRQEAELSQYRSALGNILVTALSLLSVYTLILSLIPSFENLLDVNFAASPFIIIFFALIFLPVMRQSGFPLAFFGMRLDNWRKALALSLAASAAFIGLGVLVKWIAIQTSPSLAGMTIISFADIRAGEQPVMMSPLYWFAVSLYLVLTPLQEFVARCGIQAPLYAFLHGSELKRRIWSIVVSNLVFSAAHAHISLEFAMAAFIPGMFWGWMFARTNSLLAASVSHFLIGGAGIFLFGIEEFIDKLM